MNCHNKRDFSDFNSILYGHHMAKKAMFGDIATFSEQDVFDSHRYGNLYFDGKDHGIEFFAFVHTDAYDNTIYEPAVQEEYRQAYLDNVFAKAVHARDIGVTTEDHIILLSTCSASSTNGRDILVGRITDEVYDDQIINTKMNDGIGETDSNDPYCHVKGTSILLLLLALVLTIRICIDIPVTYYRTRQYNRAQVYAY